MGAPFQLGFASSRWACTAGFLVAASLGGCASTVDTLSSQRFRDAPFHTLFVGDDPVEVLRHGQEGDARARAMLSIKEPKQSGRSDTEQDEIIQILSNSATSDQHSLCRLRAIEALSRFEDPRASQVLVAAYQNANHEASPTDVATSGDGVMQTARKTRAPFGPTSTFTADTIVTIQCRALESLGKKRSPEGLNLLCDVASRATKRELPKPAGLQQVRGETLDPMLRFDPTQDTNDLRLAAIRALENYRGEALAAQVLHQVMTSERDVAVKNRAYLSLKAVTGKSWQPAAPEWKEFLNEAAATP